MGKMKCAQQIGRKNRERWGQFDHNLVDDGPIKLVSLTWLAWPGSPSVNLLKYVDACIALRCLVHTFPSLFQSYSV
jgi:hypothetical protein